MKAHIKNIIKKTVMQTYVYTVPSPMSPELHNLFSKLTRA